MEEYFVSLISSLENKAVRSTVIALGSAFGGLDGGEPLAQLRSVQLGQL